MKRRLAQVETRHSKTRSSEAVGGMIHSKDDGNLNEGSSDSYVEWGRIGEMLRK